MYHSINLDGHRAPAGRGHICQLGPRIRRRIVYENLIPRIRRTQVVTPENVEFAIVDGRTEIRCRARYGALYRPAG